jgi:hypothetical protein
MTQGNGQPLGTLTGNPASQAGESGGDARPGLSGGDLRQIRSQANQLAGDLQDVGRQLRSSGADQGTVRSVDEVARALREMGGNGGPGDRRSLEQLTAQALEKLAGVEFGLRKKLDNSNQQLFLSGSEEIAPQFKKPVADYYRDLSKRTASGAAQTAPAPAQSNAPAKSKGGK